MLAAAVMDDDEMLTCIVPQGGPKLEMGQVMAWQQQFHATSGLIVTVSISLDGAHILLP